MGKVVMLNNITRLKIAPDRVLDSAAGKLADVIVIGYEKDKDGSFYFASSLADGAEALWLLELAKRRLLTIFDGEE